MSLRSLAISLLAVSFVSCASAPPAAPPPAKAAAAEKVRTVDLLCTERARYVTFDKLGVPEDEVSVDVALNGGNIWLLFPHRLVRIGRGAEHVEVRMQLAPPGEEWAKIDVDPLDQSVWVASQSRPVLFKVDSDGHMTTVKLPKVEGAGGFNGLAVARDALYAQPTCADTAIWRIDRSGKVLATAFPAPKPTTDEPEVLRAGGRPSKCSAVRLDRDADGNLLAWNPRERTTWQVDGQGAWTQSDSHLYEHLPRDPFSAVRGVDIGERSEHWYLNDEWAPGKLFFWKAKPVFLGRPANREKAVGTDTVLYLPGEAEAREALMTCHKAYVQSVATDATGYAAVTGRFLILGEMAGAPDLP